MIKGKLMLLPVLLVVLAAAAAGYWFVLKPKPAHGPKPAPPKVEGELVALAPEFVVNLTDGHYGKLTVALLLKEAPAGGGEGGQPVALPQDAVVRSVITDELTGIAPDDLIQRERRHQLLDRILTDLEKTTDVEVTQVLFTDVVVQ